MSTILDKIIAEKHKEVRELKNIQFEKVNYLPLSKTFYDTVKERDNMAVIAEIKRASPSKGIINDQVDPIEQARIYAENGASAISVLTDTPFFKGTMADLTAVRAIVDVPILCKDFIIDPIQIDRAKAAGANIILLIAAALNDEDMYNLYEHARQQDLEIICEVHNEEEMERTLRLNAPIIGVNNRDLKTFHVDLQTTAKIADMVDREKTILISESGIETPADVEVAADTGAEVILVGETLMRAKDVATTLRDFQIPLTNKMR